MKKEHYDYITNHFNLKSYSFENSPDAWAKWREGTMNPSTAYVVQGSVADFNICAYSEEYSTLFICIPSKELAEEIVDYIKSTEILFI